jgi:hypothetical protein
MQASEAMKLAIGANGALNRDLVAMDVWSLTMQRIARLSRLRRSHVFFPGRHNASTHDRSLWERRGASARAIGHDD